VTIRDNGPGIPEAHRDRIFDPFYTTKETGRGTGLGLAVVYGIMRDLNGNIDVSTDDGATFILHFPADGDPRDHANDM
jgi:signal transduction histidine kinase